MEAHWQQMLAIASDDQLGACCHARGYDATPSASWATPRGALAGATKLTSAAYSATGAAMLVPKDAMRAANFE